MKPVRTTITLDVDVAEKLKSEVRHSGMSLKETVNAALRRGLTTPQQATQEPFKVKPFDPGLRLGLSYDKVWDLIEFLDGPFYR